MKWDELLALVAKEPVFSSGLLLSGNVADPQVRLQLSRWVKAGRLVQLRRGLYCLAPPWQKVAPHPFLMANRLRPGTYVSLQSALAWHGMIPEHVPVVTSVGPGRPQTVRTRVGAFQFNHVAERLCFGYVKIEVANRQLAFVASAEKALLDLVHLTPGGEAVGFLKELRLQDPSGIITAAALDELARRSAKPKLIRSARRIAALLAQDQSEPL